jgi:acetoin utilization deacetylase AcuC-like enzyme
MNIQNTEGDTATHIAARNGCIAFIEMLADLGANFHLRNGTSVGALDLAGSQVKDAAQRDTLRKVMLSVEPRLRSLVLYHEDFLEHTARRASDWEGPDRLNGIMDRLRDKNEFPDYELEISNRFEKADVTLLGRVHSPEYIAFVNMLSKQVQQEAQDLQDGEDVVGPPAILPFTPQVQRFVKRQSTEELKSSEGSDTSFSVGTLSAARRAAGAVAHAVDRVMLSRNRNVFCAVRPPGHHAGYRGLLDGANSCGFCIFNSVAAGALHALEEHQCERVAIVDLDVHHGKRTTPFQLQEIVDIYHQLIYFNHRQRYGRYRPSVRASLPSVLLQSSLVRQGGSSPRRAS